MKAVKVIYLLAGGTAALLCAVHLWRWKTPERYFPEGEKISISGSEFKAAIINSDKEVIQADGLLALGLNCTKENDDPRIKFIADEWNKFKPDILLVEMEKGFFLPGIMNPVKKFGIRGKVYELAKKDGCEVYSYSLPAEAAASKLISVFSKEKTIAALAFNAYIKSTGCGDRREAERFLREYIISSGLNKLAAKIDYASYAENIDVYGKSTDRLMPAELSEIIRANDYLTALHTFNLIKHFNKVNKRVMVLSTPASVKLLQQVLDQYN